MKKLLSLLSVLTVSSATMPMVIAASPGSHQKQLETNTIVKDSDNNHQQINKNEKQNNKIVRQTTELDSSSPINRNKRSDSNIFVSSKTLEVDSGESNKKAIKSYFNNLSSIMSEMLEKEIISMITKIAIKNASPNYNYFVINKSSRINYFILPCLVVDRNKSLKLVFRTSDLYLQGFIHNTTFYHFSDSEIRNIPDLTSSNLRFDSNYNTLIPPTSISDEINISWTGIVQAFNELINYGERPDSPGNNRVISGALARVILATAESIRFRQVRNNIIGNVDTQSLTSSWGSYRDIITNWSSTTQRAINYLDQNGNLDNFDNNNGNVLVFSSAMAGNLNLCGNSANLNKRSLNPEICVKENNINIILDDNGNAYVTNEQGEVYYLNLLDGRGSEKLKGDNISDEKLKIIVKKINEEKNNAIITAIKVLDENTKGDNLSELDMYIGTNKGLYFKKYNSNLFLKTDNFDDKIININIFENGDTYAITDKREIYFINTRDFLTSNFLWGQKIFNGESSNLEKEIIMHYNNDNKHDLILENYNIINNNRIVKTFNLGKINPLNYKKIEILGNENFWTKNIWGDEIYWDGKNIYWGEKTINSINQSYLKNIIRNYKFSESNIADIGNDNPLFGNNIILDKLKTEWWGSAWFEHLQSVGFTFYWENGNYYLQFLSGQYAESRGSSSDLKQILKVGNRIRLYND